MTGLTMDEFEGLLADRRPCYEVQERLLMTLVWLRLYLASDTVGVLFAVDKSTVPRNTRPLLQLLRDHG